MTQTKQPLTPQSLKESEIDGSTPKPPDPLAALIDSYEKLEAEMRDFEEIAEIYFDKLKKSQDQGGSP